MRLNFICFPARAYKLSISIACGRAQMISHINLNYTQPTVYHKYCAAPSGTQRAERETQVKVYQRKWRETRFQKYLGCRFYPECATAKTIKPIEPRPRGGRYAECTGVHASPFIIEMNKKTARQNMCRVVGSTRRSQAKAGAANGVRWRGWKVCTTNVVDADGFQGVLIRIGNCWRSGYSHSHTFCIRWCIARELKITIRSHIAMPPRPSTNARLFYFTEQIHRLQKFTHIYTVM